MLDKRKVRISRVSRKLVMVFCFCFKALAAQAVVRFSGSSF
jgi:hypothetical protein